MKKSELKNGAVVVLRNGNAYLKVDNTLLSTKINGTFMPLDIYTQDLKKEYGDGEDDIIRVYNDVENRIFDTCNGGINNFIFGTNPTWERPKSILDDKEREYLSQVIKPFRNRVLKISKEYSSFNNYFIKITVKREKYYDYIRLPEFKFNTMYKGMTSNRYYTLEELEL